jgi:hypothetical protein
MLMARKYRESSRIPRIGRRQDISGKIREFNDAARCLSLLAQKRLAIGPRPKSGQQRMTQVSLHTNENGGRDLLGAWLMLLQRPRRASSGDRRCPGSHISHSRQPGQPAQRFAIH